VIRRRLLQLLGSLATAGFVRVQYLEAQPIQAQSQETPPTVASPEPTSSLPVSSPVFEQIIKVEWHGDPLDHFLTVHDITLTNHWALQQLSGKQASDLLYFYSGQEQWDNTVSEKRYTESRPALTVNLLPTIVARALSQSRLANEYCTHADVERCALAVTMRNMDAQRIYNYQLTQLAEIEETEPQPSP
jgi:hypothetical protein